MSELGFTLHAPSNHVTNEEFLSILYSALPDRCVGWVAHFAADPDKAGRHDWRGHAYRPGDDDYKDSLLGASRQNSFCTFSSFHEELSANGQWFCRGRLKGTYAATHAIMLDDFGTGDGSKVSLSLLRGEPSWIIRTSPGNFQVGYLLDKAEDRGELVSAVLDALVHKGLGLEKDPGMKGLTRYGRLPEGRNSKTKYLTEKGEAPAHRLVHWRPGLRYSLRSIARLYELDWQLLEAASTESPRPGPGPADVQRDPWAVLLLELGRFEPPVDKGLDGVWCDCTCPWVDEHTGRVDNGSAYRLGGGFQCHHGHCIDRTWRDVRAWLMRHEDEHVRGRALALAGDEAFGLVDTGIETEEAPPDPVSDSKKKDTSAPAKNSQGWGFDILQERVNKLLPAISGEQRSMMHDLIRDFAASSLTPDEEEILIDNIAKRVQLKTKTIQKLLKTEKEKQADTRHKNTILKRRREEAAQTGITIPILLPGEWKDTTADGKPKPTTRNLEVLVQKAGGRIQRNLMTGQLEFGGRFQGKQGDWAIQFLRDACEINDLRSPHNIVSMVRSIGEDDQYHPFQQFLEQLSAEGEENHWGWDGEDRLRSQKGLFNTILLNQTKHEVRDLILSRWLASVTAAGRHWYRNRRGDQPRGVLVFVGRQYTGKTTWLGRLFEGLFPDSGACFLGGSHFDGSVDAKMTVCGALVTELGEIDSTLNRTKQGKLKAFLSEAMDRYRRPYGHEPANLSRRTVFAGTVNKPQFLKDDTGNTRYWPISVARLDLTGQRQLDMRQVWAQVQWEAWEALKVCWEAAKRGQYQSLPWHMTIDEMRLIEEENERFRSKLVAEILLEELFDWGDPGWLRAETDRRRLKINPMTLVEIMSLTSARQLTPGQWLSALRRLTGQERAIRTTLAWETPTGETVKRNGKFWAMPPRKENIFEEIPPDIEKISVH